MVMAELKDAYPSIFVVTDVDLPGDFTNDAEKYLDFKPLAKGGKVALQTCMDSALGRWSFINRCTLIYRTM